MKNINQFSVLIFIAVICMNCSSSKNTISKDGTSTYYLVRHAEKIDDSKDPDLNQKGLDRAKTLSDLLKSKNVSHVYSTDYKRTKQTGQPLAARNGLEVQTYDPRNHPHFIEILKTRKGSTSLIVGHSNSTPSLVNLIVGSEQYPSLEHEEYNKLFIVKCDTNWSCKATVETY